VFIDFSATTAQGEARAAMYFAMSQLERETTAAKVAGAMQSLSAKGKLRGRAPFGWKFTSKSADFQPVPEQQRVLAKMTQLHVEGFAPTAIAKRLNANGDNTNIALNKKHPERFATSMFWHSSVKNILKEVGAIPGAKKTVETRIVSHRKFAASQQHDPNDLPQLTTSKQVLHPEDSAYAVANEGDAVPLVLPLLSAVTSPEQTPPRKKIVRARDDMADFEEGAAAKRRARSCAADPDCRRSVRTGRAKCDEHSRVPAADGDSVCQCTKRSVEPGRRLCSACRRRQTRQNKKAHCWRQESRDREPQKVI
jgi:hypothetical protein